MATTFKYTAYSSTTTALTTELNSLANLSVSALSAAIDNATNLEFFHDIELFLSTFAPAALGNVSEVYLVPTVDGTNYGTVVTGATLPSIPSQYLVAALPVSAIASGTFYCIGRGIQISPGLYKYGVRNRTGTTYAATANTLKYRSYTIQGV